MAVLVQNTNGHLQSRLTRTLERILEEANQSGELRLSNRKLKDFPKFGEQHVLSDTVIADLSKNRFSELPEEITSFFYLEKLVCYHNAIRYLPDGLTNLRCLSFLDLSRNQLTALPREICQLPIQILLLSNNRLKSLPDELSKMSQLTELDASCNQLAYLPPRMYELRKLQSLSLRNNMLQVLPVDITSLSLIRLDLRANRISALPVELKDMDSMVDLLLEDNPFTSPPASLCKKGRVHIFKYLETEAMNMQVKCSGLTTGGTLGRKTKKNGGSPGPTHFDRLKQKRYNIDSGYSSDDKRWSKEITGDLDKAWSNPTLLSHIEDGVIQPTISAPSINSAHENYEESEKKDEVKNVDGNGSRLSPAIDYNSSGHNGYDDKWKAPQQIQTYREYKEALKQQRAQEVSSVYRTKDNEDYSYKTAPSTPTHHSSPQSSLATSKSDPTPLNSILGSPKKIFDDTTNNKPTQKVKPCMNNAPLPISSLVNGNGTIIENSNNQQFIQDYVKPTSPLKSSTVNKVSFDNKSHAAGKQHPNSNGSATLNILYDASNGTSRSFPGKADVLPDKMTFTMRREIDKAREETDLINQLRNIIETRLKMMLPNDLTSSLTDGVVLCHLANHIKPRSVASIHVPSPAVPKLTMARCRRNVDNFIEACRKIGVDEERLCTTIDVTEALEGRGFFCLYQTVVALCEQERTKEENTPQTSHNALRDTTVSLVLLGIFFGTLFLVIVFPPPD